jgi:hypothetical protein
MAPTRVIPPIGQHAVAIAAEMKPACLRLPCQGGTYREACFKGCALLHHKFFCKESGDDDVDPLKYFNALHTSCNFFVIFSVSVMSLV